MARHSGIKDQGEFFVIDPLSRSVKVPTAHRVIGTEGEHLSEQVTFECPQIIDGHDISQCERHYVAWRNVDGTPGSDNLKVDRTEEGKVYFIWTIREGLTASKGLVQFSVHFEDVDAPYKWGTTTCKNCEILESVNAALGLYEAIYVAGDALVIADYTPVENETLALNSGSIVPDGVLKITANGKHNVREFAEAEVAVIDDPNLVPGNVKNGVNILGVTGTYLAPEGYYPLNETHPECRGSLGNMSIPVNVCSQAFENGVLVTKATDYGDMVLSGGLNPIICAKNGVVVISTNAPSWYLGVKDPSQQPLEMRGVVELTESGSEFKKTRIFKVIADDFEINLSAIFN